MDKKIKIWISLGQGEGTPHYYALSELELKTYLDHLHKIGYCGFSYDDKLMGFIQEMEISEKRFNKMTQDAQCYLWLNQNLTGIKPCQVTAMSDTMNNLATQVSEAWGKKVSKQHLLTQYSYNPKFKINEITGWNVKKFKQSW